MNKEQIIEILHSHTDGLRIGEREWIYGKVADEIMKLLGEPTGTITFMGEPYTVYPHMLVPNEDAEYYRQQQAKVIQNLRQPPDWIGVDLKKYYNESDWENLWTTKNMLEEPGWIWYGINWGKEYDDDLLERRLKGYE